MENPEIRKSGNRKREQGFTVVNVVPGNDTVHGQSERFLTIPSQRQGRLNAQTPCHNMPPDMLRLEKDALVTTFLRDTERDSDVLAQSRSKSLPKHRVLFSNALTATMQAKRMAELL